MWGVIATWEMAQEGVILASNMLKVQANVEDALEACICNVEDNPDYTSVGYGGLPNEEGLVEMDAAFMCGDTLSIGAIASLKDFKNPCKIARSLMDFQFNSFLVGAGAESYAIKNGFERKNMLTDYSMKKWEIHKAKVGRNELKAYEGHDTVCGVALDTSGKMATCTSTSGLFYKKPGRVGDSPIPGAGYYVDSDIGGACATGLGEDIMKSSTCFAIVNYMANGLSPQEACECAVRDLNDKLILKRGKSGDISVIAMNNKGEFGGASNIAEFPFVAGSDKRDVKTYVASYVDGVYDTQVKL